MELIQDQRLGSKHLSQLLLLWLDLICIHPTAKVLNSQKQQQPKEQQVTLAWLSARV
jgi:hypothetical protein